MITCCKDCVAPKRHVGCHADCQEYIDEKKKHDERKAEIDRKRHTNNAIDDHHVITLLRLSPTGFTALATLTLLRHLSIMEAIVVVCLIILVQLPSIFLRCGHLKGLLIQTMLRVQLL